MQAAKVAGCRMHQIVRRRTFSLLLPLSHRPRPSPCHPTSMSHGQPCTAWEHSYLGLGYGLGFVAVHIEHTFIPRSGRRYRSYGAAIGRRAVSSLGSTLCFPTRRGLTRNVIPANIAHVIYSEQTSSRSRNLLGNIGTVYIPADQNSRQYHVALVSAAARRDSFFRFGGGVKESALSVRRRLNHVTELDYPAKRADGLPHSDSPIASEVNAAWCALRLVQQDVFV